jgi:hypothetical protein
MIIGRCDLTLIVNALLLVKLLCMLNDASILAKVTASSVVGNELVYYAADMDMEAAHKALVEVEQYTRDHLRQLNVLVDCNQRLNELRSELSHVNAAMQPNYNEQQQQGGRIKTDKLRGEEERGGGGGDLAADEHNFGQTHQATKATASTATTTNKPASMRLEESMRLRMKDRLIQMIK